jgi:pimeloyl-ACP methyl ester carboxylesterase
MVTSSNAYWLDFFLRRECNVYIWNYRGYGESEQSLFTPNYDPHQEKIDVERVLQFLINKIRVKGPVGVYGRSIGGIAASHLVNKFPNVIKVFVGDRTMDSFDATA